MAETESLPETAYSISEQVADPDVVSPFYHVCEGDRVLVGPLGRESLARGFQRVFERQGYDTSIDISELPYVLSCRICGVHITEESARQMTGATGETIATYCGHCAEIERPDEANGRISGYLVSCPLCGSENVAHRSADGVECENCEAFFNPKKQWVKNRD